MRIRQVSDLFELGRSLAQSAARRGVGPADAPAVIARSLPSFFAEQRDLLQALSALLQHPACTTLLGADQPEARRLARQQLLERSGTHASSPGLALKTAFVDGLAEGWHQEMKGVEAAGRSGAAREPDLLTWLLGLGAGVVVGGGLAWLGLTAFQLVGRPSGTGSAPVGLSAPAGVTPQVAATATPAPSEGLERCVNLAFAQRETQRLAAASNFGKRQERDASGAPIPSKPALVVVHETVLDLPSTIDLFQRNQADDAAQGSYHVLIGRDGERVRIVPDESRAYGAGDSAFGDLRFKTSAANPPSINNIALHVSLESPADGRGEVASHSGYTAVQYRALAEQVLHWQALYGIAMERVTTHAAVDRSHSRYDPRSFRWDLFDQAYGQVRRSCA